VDTLLGKAGYFHLSDSEAIVVLGEVHGAIRRWRSLAMSVEVGLTPTEIEDFAPAFDHSEMDRAHALSRQ